MNIRFDDKKLARMAEDPSYSGGFGDVIVRSFRFLVKYIRDARSTQDLYALKSLRFEKLQGKRQDQRSLRLNKQFRLIVELEGNLVIVKSIEDYHGKRNRR